jgi:hypothetical protein
LALVRPPAVHWDDVGKYEWVTEEGRKELTGVTGAGWYPEDSRALTPAVEEGGGVV